MNTKKIPENTQIGSISFDQDARLAELGRLFKEALDTENLPEILGKNFESIRERIFTPLVTVWVFITQVMSANKTCKAALAAFILQRPKKERGLISSLTGGYCTARKRLPLTFLQDLFHELVRKVKGLDSEQWKWRGKEVKLIDGTYIELKDTADIQAKYPAHTKKNDGSKSIPTLKIVAVFSLSCRCLLDFVYAPTKGKDTSENVLLNRLLETFSCGDLLVFDRYFTGFFNLATLLMKKIDFISKQHHRRSKPFAIKRINRRERLIYLKKPHRRKGSWWTDDTQVYDMAPSVIELREIDVSVAIKGFRVKKFTIITNMLDVPAIEIQDLYYQRWFVELDIRDIKTTMQMARLSTESAAMVEKELYVHFLAYNLVILLIMQSAKFHRILPRKISFKTAMTMYSTANLIAGGVTQSMITTLILYLGQHRVGDRPNRVEPRAIKVRRQRYPLLRGTRESGKLSLLN